jgi:hypothetical protein
LAIASRRAHETTTATECRESMTTAGSGRHPVGIGVYVADP